MDPSVLLQRQVRNNAEDLQTFMSDLRSWEEDMKRRESEMLGHRDGDKEYPPVRSKSKKKTNMAKESKPDKRISSSDYSAWEKFDVDKACEKVDDENKKKPPEDSKKSSEDKKELLREEAQYEKEKGNSFVHLKKWNEAIACYTRAIDLYKYDATFYANRALCYLKNENLHAAEGDCTSALELDPTYVKALLRRSSAREGLGSLRRAASDLTELLRLEPRNESVKTRLNVLIRKMGTKGPNSKSSPVSTPSEDESRDFSCHNSIDKVDIDTSNKECENEKNNVIKVENEEPKMMSAENEKEVNEEKEYINNTVLSYANVQPIEKPPHLRSKKPLVRIQAMSYDTYEKNMGLGVQKKADYEVINDIIATRLNNKKSLQSDDTKINHKVAFSDENVVSFNEAANNKSQDNNVEIVKINHDVNSISVKQVDEVKEKTDENSNICNNLEFSSKDNEKIENILPKFSVPKTSIQFLSDWRLMQNRIDERSAYLKAIPSGNLCNIFKNSLESDTLSEILYTLLHGPDFISEDFTYLTSYLKSISEVKRFQALAMFLSDVDKQVVNKLIERCLERENISQEDFYTMKRKYNA